MSERYKTLYRIPENLYIAGSPVIIAAGALLKDNQTGKVLAQLKFRSISDKRIKAVKIRILAFDVIGASVGDAVEHQYLDLNVMRNDEFGSKEAVSLASDTTRSFRAQISNVVYLDGSIWSAANDAAWSPLKAQQKLSSMLKDDELVKQYTIETESNGNFVPEEVADLWLCSCGTVNHKSEEHCVSCKKALTVLIEALDVSMLTEKKHAREEAERIAQEKTEEECRQKIEMQQKAEKQKIEDQRIRRQALKKRTKRLSLFVVPIIVVCIIAFILATKVFIPQTYYSQGEECLEKKDYAGAAQAFTNAGDYKDSAERRIDICESFLAGKRSECISVSWTHTVGLRGDGTVVATGDNSSGQCDVSNWTDIIAVSAGINHTVGLRFDGTVIAVGSNIKGQIDVSDWTDIIAVSAGYCYTVGLKVDGTVVATGANYVAQCDVSNWTDIIAVSAGFQQTMGLRSDGTVVATGSNSSGQCDVSDWTDIIAVSAGYQQTMGLRSDGTVVATGSNSSGQCDVSDWTDIIAVSAGKQQTVGLRSDGTVVATGSNSSCQCDVSDWTDIIAVSAGNKHTVGLRSDGTVVAVGPEEYVSGWTNEWKMW